MNIFHKKGDKTMKNYKKSGALLALGLLFSMSLGAVCNENCNCDEISQKEQSSCAACCNQAQKKVDEAKDLVEQKLGEAKKDVQEKMDKAKKAVVKKKKESSEKLKSAGK